MKRKCQGDDEKVQKRRKPTVTFSTIQTFMNKPAKSVEEYYNCRTDKQVDWMDDHITCTQEARDKIRGYPQGTDAWKKSRIGRCTGSVSAEMVGHLRYNNTTPVHLAYNLIHVPFQPNVATIWGNEHEQEACNQYVECLCELVWQAWHDRKDPNSFVFRGVSIPCTSDKKPDVYVGHLGLVIDPYYPWRGVSYDGIIFINDIAVGVLEIKCPYYKEHAPYPNIPLNYYDQCQSNLHVARKIWGEQVLWCDFFVWGPSLYTLDTLSYNHDYFTKWYFPRECRWYFTEFLPRVVEVELLK